jgi:hypothetical protein
MTPTPATLHELRCAWQEAKALEAKAAQERRAIEDAILALLPSKTEGTVTDKDSGIKNDPNEWAGNTSAEHFYEKMGMKTKERQMEYIL